MAKMSRGLFRWRRAVISIRFAGNIICAALLCIAALSYADRQPGSLSTIKTNRVTGSIEIIHRLHNHDAELGVIAALGDKTLTLDKLVGRAQLALYVEEHFILAALKDDRIGAPLDLELIGAELDGEFILVYQEFNGELPTHIAVRDDILRDVFPGQVNHVNIAVGPEVRSLIFQGEDEWLVASID
jgi:hypothetical protein